MTVENETKCSTDQCMTRPVKYVSSLPYCRICAEKMGMTHMEMQVFAERFKDEKV